MTDEAIIVCSREAEMLSVKKRAVCPFSARYISELL
jgi:hypothetical protein